MEPIVYEVELEEDRLRWPSLHDATLKSIVRENESLTLDFDYPIAGVIRMKFAGDCKFMCWGSALNGGEIDEVFVVQDGVSRQWLESRRMSADVDIDRILSTLRKPEETSMILFSTFYGSAFGIACRCNKMRFEIFKVT